MELGTTIAQGTTAQLLETESMEGWKDSFHMRALFTQRKKCDGKHYLQ